MKIHELTHKIRFSNYTNDELNMLIDAIKYRRSLLAEEKKDMLFPGLQVKFTNSRTGAIVKGYVEKVNRKFVLVREDRDNTYPLTWRVPATMLEKSI